MKITNKLTLALLLTMFSLLLNAQEYWGKIDSDYTFKQGNIEYDIPIQTYDNNAILQVEFGLRFSSLEGESTAYGRGWSLYGVDSIEEKRLELGPEPSPEVFNKEYFLNGHKIFETDDGYLVDGLPDLIVHMQSNALTYSGEQLSGNFYVLESKANGYRTYLKKQRIKVDQEERDAWLAVYKEDEYGNSLRISYFNNTKVVKDVEFIDSKITFSSWNGLVSSIDVYYKNALKHSYKLSIDGYHNLNKVDLCAGQKCVDPITFEYQRHDWVSSGDAGYDTEDLRHLSRQISSRYNSFVVNHTSQSTIEFTFTKGVASLDRPLQMENPAPEDLAVQGYLLTEIKSLSEGKILTFEYHNPIIADKGWVDDPTGFPIDEEDRDRFWGFEKITEKHTEGGGQSYTITKSYHHEYPLYGEISSIQESGENGYILTEHGYDTPDITPSVYRYGHYNGDHLHRVLKTFESVTHYVNGQSASQEAVTFDYDSEQRVTKRTETYTDHITGIDDFQKVTSYDDFGNGVLPGRVESISYHHGDSEGQLTTSFAYENHHVKTKTDRFEDGNSKLLTNTYNELGLLLNAETRSYTPVVNANGVVSSTAPRVYNTEYTYEGYTRTSKTNPLTQTTRYIPHASCPNPSRVENIDDTSISYTYDAFCRISDIAHSDGTEEHYDYSYGGDHSYYQVRHSSNTEPATSEGYSPFDELITSIRESVDGRLAYTDHKTYKYSYTESKEYFEGDPKYTEVTSRDIFNRDSKITNTFGVTYFDYDQNKVVKTNAEGHQETSYFDSSNNITRVIRGNTDVEFSYNFDGQVISVNNSGQITRSVYDSRGNLLESHDPVKGTTLYRYDGDNNLVWKKEANGRLTKYVYDLINRLVRTTYIQPDGRVTSDTMVWDTASNGIGQLAKETSEKYTKLYSYDTHARLSTETLAIDGQRFVKQYLYSGPLLDSIIYPDSVRIYKEYSQSHYLIAEYLNGTDLAKPSSGQYSNALNEIEELKREAEASIERNNAILDTLKSEMERLAQENYRQTVADNLEQYDVHTDAYVGVDGEIYLEGDNGQWYQRIYDGDYQCYRSSSDRAGCSSERIKVFYMKPVSDPLLVLHDGSTIHASQIDEPVYVGDVERVSGYDTDNGNGEAGEEPEIEPRIQEIFFYWMDSTLTLEARQELAELTIGVHDEIYNLHERGGYYQDVLMELEALETRILRENNSAHQQRYTSTPLQHIVDSGDRYVIWSLGEVDAHNRVMSIAHGNSLSTFKHYNPVTSQLENIVTSGAFVYRDQEYRYDKLNNMTLRVDEQANLRERFGYDANDRLKHVQREGLDGSYYTSKYYYYDEFNNMKHRDYSYANDNPYKVSQFKSNSYSYDAIGNITRYGSHQVEYGKYNRPVRINDGSADLRFSYDVNGNYISRSSNGETAYFFGDDFKIDYNGQNWTSEVYISAYGESQAVVKSENNQLIDINYLYADPLGSVDMIADVMGVVIQKLHYTPFGERSYVPEFDEHPLSQFPIYERGFTNQLSIEEFGLVHMRGRIYDPQLKRFLSADPTVPDPLNALSYNRYAYVKNNPLKYTDPTGFSEESVDKSANPGGSHYEVADEARGQDKNDTQGNSEGSETLSEEQQKKVSTDIAVQASVAQEVVNNALKGLRKIEQFRQMEAETLKYYGKLDYQIGRNIGGSKSLKGGISIDLAQVGLQVPVHTSALDADKYVNVDADDYWEQMDAFESMTMKLSLERIIVHEVFHGTVGSFNMFSNDHPAVINATNDFMSRNFNELPRDPHSQGI
ncbi:RHS repeat domain-containing protein [Agarivorans sp. QJM3NY_25]|uniref:RHS repeat domain-containing protein n=1 Tax=Agarivorans sp. QJM3NY_25 TaxID=3421430 RepID=UPI003D7EE71B